MNKFQRKVMVKVKEFENNTNNFNIMMEMDDNMVQLNDGYHVGKNKNNKYEVKMFDNETKEAKLMSEKIAGVLKKRI